MVEVHPNAFIQDLETAATTFPQSWGEILQAKTSQDFLNITSLMRIQMSSRLRAGVGEVCEAAKAQAQTLRHTALRGNGPRIPPGPPF